MTTSSPRSPKRADGGGRVLLDRVGDRDDAGGTAVDGDEDRGLALGGEPPGRLPRASSESTPASASSSLAADQHRRVRRRSPGRPWPVIGVEVARLAESDPPAPRHRRRSPRRAGAPTSARPRPRGAAAPPRRSRRRRRRRSGPARPSVIVPVLSRTIVSSLCAVSSASAERIRTPFSAPLPVPTMIDSGVASPSAHGQAMISTDTARHERERERRGRARSRTRSRRCRSR